MGSEKVIYKKNIARQTKRKSSRRKNSKNVFKALFRLYTIDKRPFLLLVASLIFAIAAYFIPYGITPQSKSVPQTKKIITGKTVLSQSPNLIAKEYADFYQNKNYGGLWNLYASSYQNYIQTKIGKNNYLSFLQKKFSNVTVQKYSLSTCMNGQTIFPYGVERNYQHVCHLHINYSLVSPDASISAQLSDISLVPVVIAKIGKLYAIVGGGPTDLQAPVLFSNNVINHTLSVPVIMYHRIAPMPRRSDYTSNYDYLIDVGLTVTPENFTTQMDQLQIQGYHPISPNDLFNNLYYNLPLPDKPILLTFDDGRKSDFTNGLPILLAHHFTAMYMIPPYLTGKLVGYHNHNQYMTFADLQILAQDGMYIENHSLKHDRPLWNIPPVELVNEMNEANTMLFGTTHYPVQFVAYPGRWPYKNWNQLGPAEEVTEQVLSQMGFAMSFLDLGQNEALEDSMYPYQIPRIRGNNIAVLPLQ